MNFVIKKLYCFIQTESTCADVSKKCKLVQVVLIYMQLKVLIKLFQEIICVIGACFTANNVLGVVTFLELGGLRISKKFLSSKTF